MADERGRAGPGDPGPACPGGDGERRSARPRVGGRPSPAPAPATRGAHPDDAGGHDASRGGGAYRDPAGKRANRTHATRTHGTSGPSPGAPRLPGGTRGRTGRPRGKASPPRSDRWLVSTVVVVAVLVVAAATALIVSLTGSSAPPSSTITASVPSTTVPSHSPQTEPRSGTAPSTNTPTSPPPTSTSTTVPVAPAGPPVISSLSPSSGSAGQSVTITGANFLSSSGQIVATFNGQVAPTSCPAQSTCTVTVPPSTAPSAQVVDHDGGGRVQRGDLHLQLSMPQQLAHLVVRRRGEVVVPLAHGEERLRAGHAETSRRRRPAAPDSGLWAPPGRRARPAPRPVPGRPGRRHGRSSRWRSRRPR